MEIKIGFVYKITNPSGRIYIGSTNDVQRRKYQYNKNYFKNQIKIHRSIEKYGWNSHIFEILWSGNIEEMLKKEAEIGNALNVLDKNNLNLRLPKINDIFVCISEETRLKMSNSAKRKIISEKNKEKIRERIRETHTGKIVSLETRQKMSERQIGKKMSDEAKKKMSEKAKGRIMSEETKIKISKYHSKPVLQFDLEGNFIKEWKSASEVQKNLKINAGHVGACCRKQRKTAGKFKWQFKN